MPFVPLSKISRETMVSRTPLKRQVEASQVLEYASNVLVEIFGKEQAYHSKPLFFKHRTLTITCSSATMAQEIRINQNIIVNKINDKLGKKEVDSIRYLV